MSERMAIPWPVQIMLQAAVAVRDQSRLRRYAVAAMAGAMSVLAFAPYHFAPVLFLTLPVLLWLSEPTPTINRFPADTASRWALPAVALHVTRQNLGRGFAIGWWFGFGFHLAGLYWIGGAFLVQAEVFAWLLPVAVMLMPAGLAIFHGIAMMFVASVGGSAVARLLAFVIALSISEWLRGNIFTGFPWNILGYALAYPLVLLQSAGVVGIYGLTLLSVAVFAAPLYLLTAARSDCSWRRYGLVVAGWCIGPLAIMLAYGGFILIGQKPVEFQPGVKLRLVQPSIPQRDKFDPQKRLEIFKRHLDLSVRGTLEPGAEQRGLDDITHVLWPEAALAFLALRTPEVLSAVAKRFPDNVILLAGTLRLDGDLIRDGRKLKVYNSAMVLNGKGAPVTTYDKVHLVPFGEYLPFQEILEAVGLEQLTRIRGGFTPGRPATGKFAVPGLPALRMLICYEVIFPGEVLPSARPGGMERPQLLINLTNDAWYGNTAGPYQHFHQSLVRAVEQGIPLIRVGNNGISASVGPYGRTIARLDLDQVGALDIDLPKAGQPTLYGRFGDQIFGICLFMLILIFSIAGCNRHSRSV